MLVSKALLLDVIVLVQLVLVHTAMLPVVVSNVQVSSVKERPPYFGNCLRKSPNSPVELASASAMSLHRQNISSLPPNTEIMRISVSYDDPEHVSVYRNLQIISKLDNLSVFVVVRVCMRIK